MIHLNVLTEGQTELSFVKNILAPHLAQYNVFTVSRSVLTSKDNRTNTEYRGGMNSYLKAKNDLTTWMKENKRDDWHFTTMFDLYALPNDFPGFTDASRENDPYKRVKVIEDAFVKDIESQRFTPYIQLHEFEALILSNPEKLDWEYLEHEKPIQTLIELTGNFDSPELINDGNETAPSKRIIREIPEYKQNKASSGILVAQKIGLPTMRNKCPHFNQWLTNLETLK